MRALSSVHESTGRRLVREFYPTKMTTDLVKNDIKNNVLHEDVNCYFVTEFLLSKNRNKKPTL
jgi:hypothetical protein